MGQGISLPITTIPDALTIYNKTQPTIDIMNKILDFVLKNADYRDMLALADEKQCEKWIIVAEDQLNKLFTRIKLKPERDSSGILYLKKLETLKASSDKVGCKLLAAFFVRLFQVVGALSLSVIDTKIPNSTDYSAPQGVLITQKGIPFFKQLPEDDKKKKFLGLFGGDLTEDRLREVSENLHFFRYYLIVDEKDEKRYSLLKLSKERKILNTVDGISIGIENKESTKLVFNSKVGVNSLSFEIIPRGTSLLVNVIKRNNKDYPYSSSFDFTTNSNNTISVIKDSKNVLDFTDFITDLITSINKLPPSQTLKLLEELGYLETSNIQPYFKKIKNLNFGENSGIFVNKDNFYSEEPKFIFACTIKENTKAYTLLVSFRMLIIKTKTANQLDNYSVRIVDLTNVSSSDSIQFKPQFKRLDNSGENSLETKDIYHRNFTVKNSMLTTNEPTNGNLTIPAWLEKMFNIVKNEADDTLKSKPLTKDGYLNPISDSGIKDERLKTQELWMSLRRNPPVKSFCTARALQLLNISGLQKILPEVVRPLIFNTTFDLVKDGSLPRPKEPITTATGIKALSLLYKNFDGIYDFKNKKTPNFTIGEIVLKSFILNEELRNTLIKNKETKLDDIMERSGTTVEPLNVKTNKKKVDLLRNQAVLLFQIQFEHTAKVNTLLKKMFVFTEPITLNSSILSEGLVGIEKIAKEARELLTEYYSNCQVEYTTGIRILENESLSKVSAKK